MPMEWIVGVVLFLLASLCDVAVTQPRHKNTKLVTSSLSSSFQPSNSPTVAGAASMKQTPYSRSFYLSTSLFISTLCP